MGWYRIFTPENEHDAILHTDTDEEGDQLVASA
jgi:hypothetical protein